MAHIQQVTALVQKANLQFMDRHGYSPRLVTMPVSQISGFVPVRSSDVLSTIQITPMAVKTAPAHALFIRRKTRKSP